MDLDSTGALKELQTVRPRLMLADDHTILVEGVRKLLEKDYDVVGVVPDGRELVTEATRLQPDVMVVDIGMPLLNGIEATRQLRHCVPNAKIVILTQQSDQAYVREAFRAGATAYLLKQTASAELLLALRQVLEGFYYVSQSLASGDLAKLDPRINPASHFDQHLTPRQREVLQLIAEGKTAKEVASVLDISVKTAEFHKSSIMNELGIRTTAELTRYAIAHGIVQG